MLPAVVLVSSGGVKAPLRSPVAMGMKVTLMVQEPPPPTLPPQALVWEKSPAAVTLAMVSAAVPVLLTVIRSEALAVPIKVKVRGESLGPGVVPVPVRLTV